VTASAAGGRHGDGSAFPLAGVCSGCVGRGTGVRCCICGGEIPPELWRAPEDSRPEYDATCGACRAGARHVHGAVS
jgi:hypothetical protein